MSPGNGLIVGLIILTSFAADGEIFTGDKELENFLKTIDQVTYQDTTEGKRSVPSDIVFVLDESTSIEDYRYKEVKLFTKLVVQRLTVSPNDTRVAVITYSSGYRTPINYIAYPDGKNMCTLLKGIGDLVYAGGYTHTSIAMQAAGDILQSGRARKYAEKIIVLLSDGASTRGYNPIDISRILKNDKRIRIFAVGVANVNMHEIQSVATSPDHVYKLKNFDLQVIKDMNRQIVEDAIELSMGPVEDSSFCSSVCGYNAICSCGLRTGRYECACIAGYERDVYCRKCPKGTYKSAVRNSKCTPCPPHSSTNTEGCTNVAQCVCETGYDKRGYACEPVRCPTLTPPEGGILIPSHCNNTFGSQCSFICREGYCQNSCRESETSGIHNRNSPLLTRTCLHTKMWSGQEFQCEKITCPELQHPQNGMHNCSKNDFTFGTSCRFHCDIGYELSGSTSRTCLSNGWTGDDVTCEIIHCQPLKSNMLLSVDRIECATRPMPYKAECQYHCRDGFVVVGNGTAIDEILRCEANKMWSSGQNDFSCQDVEPPTITCPSSIVIEAEPHKSYALVEWNHPKAMDNDPWFDPEILMYNSEYLQKPPLQGVDKVSFYFPIGDTIVIYKAIDHWQLSSTCSFVVVVLDSEAPELEYCPSDIEVYHHVNEPIQVIWIPPIFRDNSNKVTRLSNHKPGDSFSWGPATTVVYTGLDEALNAKNCSFQVKIKPYPCPYYAPPANGLVICDNDGRTCKVFCHDGFDFAVGENDFDRTCTCKQIIKDGIYGGVWEPHTQGKNFKMPWPDCSKIQDPAYLNATVELDYNVSVCSEEKLRNFKQKFLTSDVYNEEICPEGRVQCSTENLKVSCNNVSIDSQEKNSRNFHGRSSDVPIISINVNLPVFPNASNSDIPGKKKSETGNATESSLSSILDLDDLEIEITGLLSGIYDEEISVAKKVKYNVTVVCHDGQIIVNQTCVNCPAGTHKNNLNQTCDFCTEGTYQDEERQFTCKSCPIGFTTYGVKSKSADDCKGPCQPGTYSKTGFEPCVACALNTYQSLPQRTECEVCPSGLYNLRVGATSLDECTAPCKQGTYSVTGFEPCHPCEVGSYQDLEKQTNCTICPYRQTTSSEGSKQSSDCKDFDICTERQPCQHGATCTQLDKDYECLCPNGLVGKDCEVDLDDCASSPCLNNGTCADGVGNFTCICDKGWTGLQCQESVDDCEPNPCLNGAFCLDFLNNYTCLCQAGFTGEKCEININECVSNPCLNNGICFDMQNGFRCCCNKGFYGPNCENKLTKNVCDSVTCQNGGTCSAEEENFECECPPGFEGVYCESNIDDCLNHTCENGGVCIDGIEKASCDCPDIFFGLWCEFNLFDEYILNFPTPSTANYVLLNNDRRLYEITASFFMRTDFQDSSSRATPISYSYKYGRLVDNALTLFDTNKFILYLHGTKLYTAVSGNSDSKWHHYAVTWEKTKGKWAFYLDGQVESSGQNVGEDSYMHPGTFVIGQEQDDVGSQFSELDAFSGDIAEFNVWDYAMTAEEIENISKTCGNIGNVIAWHTVRQNISGYVEVLYNTSNTYCLGTCEFNSRECLYGDPTRALSYKNKVSECTNNTCENGQPCISSELGYFCNCDVGFEGRRCQYDIDECLDNNGDCEYICVNDVGTGSYHCECPSDMLLTEDGKTCHDTSYCIKGGKKYVNGETWVKNCQNCICDGGIVKCEDIVCPEFSCLPEQSYYIFPGQCCPKCVTWSLCELYSSNNAIKYFNQTVNQLDVLANYTAVEDCILGRFKIRIEFPTKQVHLVLYQDCTKLAVSSDGKVFVDDDIVDLPLKNDLWDVSLANNIVSIRSSGEFNIAWNLGKVVSIALPVSLSNQVCGLCKTMDDYYIDKSRNSMPWYVVVTLRDAVRMYDEAKT